MDKKTAEDEALRKAKENQAAAGKNTGMSGRDLVSRLQSREDLFPSIISLQFAFNYPTSSSNITLNGSMTKTGRMRMTGILSSTVNRKRMRIWRRKRLGLQL